MSSSSWKNLYKYVYFFFFAFFFVFFCFCTVLCKRPSKRRNGHAICFAFFVWKKTDYRIPLFLLRFPCRWISNLLDLCCRTIESDKFTFVLRRQLVVGFWSWVLYRIVFRYMDRERRNPLIRLLKRLVIIYILFHDSGFCRVSTEVYLESIVIKCRVFL